MSHKGHDDIKCGVNHHPCHTLSYTLEQRAKDDDVIQINGEDGTPYPIKRQNLVLRNITLIGTGSRARIAGEVSVIDTYLFADVSRSLNTSPEQVSINLVNLKLIGIGIIKLKNTLKTLNIHVVNCTVLKLSKSYIVDSSAAKTAVILKNTINRHVSKGLHVKSREFSLNITSSKIDNSGWSYPGQDCPQFIVTDQFELLVAHLSKSLFKYTCQQKSNVTIIDSIFDDGSKNIKHNRCFSSISLRNTNALIVNSNFTNIISRKSLIKAIDSFVTFKECIFSNISKLGMFSLSSSIVASLNNINGINNNLNELNYGSVYLLSTKGIFQNCTFHNNTVNGQHGTGGAMCISSSNVTVQQCLFKENTVTYGVGGGAIFMQETRGSFVNCTFERNSVESSLKRNGYGGAVCAIANSHLTVHHCLFKENTATFSGGATYIQESHIDVKQCLFKENTATYAGGAISMKKTRGSFVNCTFERNSVESSSQRNGYGGAVCAITNSYLTVHHCLFKENTATYIGGATYIQESHIDVKQCLFKENTATDGGGAISMKKTRGSFVNCTFERNSVESRLQRYHIGGAVSARTNSHLTMHHCLFKENTATSSGGATYIHESHIDIKQCLFKENTANYSGGAISMKKTRGSFVNCTFERNSVESRLQRYHIGGAVSARTNSHLTMHHCLFKENTATSSGGATYIQESHIDIKQCLFKENTATDDGGAISMKKTRGSFVNCTFERNSVESHSQRDDFGGAVSAITNSHLTVQHCLFKENTATFSGGATYIQESHIAIKQCLFKENTVKCSGGAISMRKTRGSFVNCTFERNSVESHSQRDDFGGAVSAITNSHLTMHHCLFKENTATYIGGATYIQESHIDIKQCLFKENTVTDGGGAIFMKETRALFVNCTFESNFAESRSQRYGYGAAVNAITSSHLTVHHSLFKENEATSHGGAIFIQASHINVEQCFFKENTVNYSGGAIFMNEAQGSFENCTFADNAVQKLQETTFGGAISSIRGSFFRLTQCFFKKNTATFYGGACYIQRSQGSFENCTFEGKV